MLEEVMTQLCEELAKEDQLLNGSSFARRLSEKLSDLACELLKDSCAVRSRSSKAYEHYRQYLSMVYETKGAAALVSEKEPEQNILQELLKIQDVLFAVAEKSNHDTSTNAGPQLKARPEVSAETVNATLRSLEALLTKLQE